MLSYLSSMKVDLSGLVVKSVWSGFRSYSPDVPIYPWRFRYCFLLYRYRKLKVIHLAYNEIHTVPSGYVNTMEPNQQDLSWLGWSPMARPQSTFSTAWLVAWRGWSTSIFLETPSPLFLHCLAAHVSGVSYSTPTSSPPSPTSPHSHISTLSISHAISLRKHPRYITCTSTAQSRAQTPLLTRRKRGGVWARDYLLYTKKNTRKQWHHSIYLHFSSNYHGNRFSSLIISLLRLMV